MGFSFQYTIFSKACRFLFLLFVVALPLSQRLSTWLLIACFALSLVLPWKNVWVRTLHSGWSFFLYVALLLIGMLYTEDTITGWKVIETHFVFLLLPFVFGKIFLLDNREENKILSFLLGVTVSGLVYIGKGIYDSLRLDQFSETTFYEATSLLDFDPTYVAYFMVAGLTLVIYQLSVEESFIPPLLSLFIILVLFSVLLVAMNQTAFIAFLFILAFFLFQFVVDSTKHKRNAMLVAVVLLVGMFAARHYIDLRPDLYVSDTGERFALWKSALFANSHIFTGVGTGDYTHVLTEYYKAHQETKFAAKEFNAHNQYINTWLAIGLPGLLALIMMFSPLYFSTKSRYTLGILLIFPFTIYACSEVFLGRYQGLVMWAFLHQLVMNTSLYELAQKSIRVNTAWLDGRIQNKL